MQRKTSYGLSFFILVFLFSKSNLLHILKKTDSFVEHSGDEKYIIIKQESKEEVKYLLYSYSLREKKKIIKIKK